QARLVEALGARSALVVPLVANDQPVGVLTLVRASGEPYTAADLTVARGLADRVALAVARGRQHRSVEAERRRLGDLLEGLGVIAWEADPLTLDVTVVDRRARAVLGYSDAQWSRPGFWTGLIHPDDRERVLTTIRERQAAGEGVTLEYRLAAADGRLLWIEHLVQPARDETGRAVADWCLVHLTGPVGGRHLHAAGADAAGRVVAEAIERLAPALDVQAVLPLFD